MRRLTILPCAAGALFAFGYAALAQQPQIKVKDGDSVIVDGKEYRLRNHNAPEIGTRGRGRPKCAAERELGEKASERLGQLVAEGRKNGTLEFKDTGGKDRTHAKRPLAEIKVNGQDVGKTLRQESLAKRSSGPGHKDFCR
jgi:endonuclease YncB( thermonuclease family)